MISVMSTLKNRANLLNIALQAIREQTYNGPIELQIGDGGSSDSLDDVLKEWSKVWSVNKWFIDRSKSHYEHPFNCPALEYNFLVKQCKTDYIVKIDPEAVFITKTFIERGLKIMEENKPTFIMPLPFHVTHFPAACPNDVRERYDEFVYKTHINEHSAQYVNVYYGCLFRRQDWINLGGIDMRYLGAIGSEDDAFFDRFRAVYGTDRVITLLDERLIHMWHGEWGRGVPQELMPWVRKNGELRTKLINTNPNDGNFASIKFPDEVLLTKWEKGEIVFQDYVSQI